MSKDTLVVLHLEGKGLVSSWLKDLVLPPERGTEYHYQGDLYVVAQALQYLGDSKSTGGNKLFGVLSALYPPLETTELFHKLKHLGRDATTLSAIGLIVPGKTPGLSVEPERIMFLVCRKQGENQFNFAADFPTAVSADTATTEPLVVLDVNGQLNTCWLKNLPMVPHIGSQFLRGNGTFQVKRAVEVLTGNDSGETNQLIKLLTAIYENPGVPAGLIASMTALDGGESSSGLILTGNEAKLGKPERIVYLAVNRVTTGSDLATMPANAVA
jgi:hypothetical protein